MTKQEVINNFLRFNLENYARVNAQFIYVDSTAVFYLYGNEFNFSVDMFYSLTDFCGGITIVDLIKWTEKNQELLHNIYNLNNKKQ